MVLRRDMLMMIIKVEVLKNDGADIECYSIYEKEIITILNEVLLCQLNLQKKVP